MPLFSVIIPVYNAQAFVKEALVSVLDQTSTNWELIVIDDGSTDKSAKIIAQVLDGLENAHVITQANHGLGQARNRAVMQAKGQWLVFLDADDYWAPSKLEQLEACLQTQPNADVIYHPVLEMKPNGLMRKRAFWPVHNNIDLIEKGNPLVPSAMAIKRTVFNQHGGFIEDRNQVEDLLFWFTLFNAGATFVAHNSALTVYRMGAGVTAAIEDHLSKTFKAVDQAIATGILPARVEHVFKNRKYYEAARQLHKLGAFKHAQHYYAKSTVDGVKARFLLLMCKLLVVV